MEPMIKEGSTVIVNRFFNPQKKDVVALQHPTKPLVLIKRIHEISDEGFRVIGDNAEESTDSRQFGLVERKRLLGKVVAVL